MTKPMPVPSTPGMVAAFEEFEAAVVDILATMTERNRARFVASLLTLAHPSALAYMERDPNTPDDVRSLLDASDRFQVRAGGSPCEEFGS